MTKDSSKRDPFDMEEFQRQATLLAARESGRQTNTTPNTQRIIWATFGVTRDDGGPIEFFVLASQKLAGGPLSTFTGTENEVALMVRDVGVKPDKLPSMTIKEFDSLFAMDLSNLLGPGGRALRTEIGPEGPPNSNWSDFDLN